MQQKGVAPGGSLKRPRQMPRESLKQVVRGVYREVQGDNVGIVAAAIAYYAMLAIFPALIMLVSLYGLLFDPADVQAQVASLSRLLPESARPLVNQFLHGLVNEPESGLSLALLLGVVGALWSASAGTLSLIRGINMAYDIDETRNFIKLRGLAVLLTLGVIVFVLVSFAVVAVLPGVLDNFGLGEIGKKLITISRWPLMALAVIAGSMILYRVAPNRKTPGWRWLSWGSLVATVLWLGASMLFSFYASNFGNFAETYGALAGVIVLLLWFYLSAFALLVGAEVNAELEAERTRLSESVGRGPGTPAADAAPTHDWRSSPMDLA
jgi:membrane protein